MTTITINPSADSEYQEDSPDFNNGLSLELNIGEEDFGDTNYRASIKFDFSSIPVGALITAASLTMTCFNDHASGTGRIKIYKTTSTWTETGVTWNNQPSYDASLLSYVDIADGFTGDKTLTGLAAIVKAWFEGTVTNYGFNLRITHTDNEAEDDRHFEFRSREYSVAGERPRLAITYIERGGISLAML